jgi:cysteine-rich repeat protein
MLNGAARLVVAVMLAISPPGAAAGAEPAVTFDFPHTGGCGPNNVEGWQFQTTASVTVSALGVYDSSDGDGPVMPGNGLNFAIPVGLYDSGCTQLASVTVPAGTAATLISDYRYVGIAPLVLAAGQTYRVAAVMHCDDFTASFQSATGFSLNAALTAAETRRIGFASSLACPTETSTNIDFATNFLIGPACGNGVVQDGEQCDDGNTMDGDCCSATCQYESEGSPCPADDEECTDDVCDETGTCTHQPSPSGMVCRPAPGECDAPESCDGNSPSCPPDGFMPNGTPCIDDGLFCSGSETCQNGSCTSGGDPCAGAICDEDGDQCVTPSPTVTRTASATAMSTSTASVTRTPASTPTGSQASTPTGTPVSSATGSQISTPTRTQASTATGTVVPPGTPTATASTPGTIIPSATPTDTPAPTPCVGDCDGSCDITISELIIGVNIALGTLSIDRCPAFDASGNGGVEINELITAVRNALNGCPESAP